MTTDLLQRMATTLSSGLATGAEVPADDEALYAWVADHLVQPGASSAVVTL